MVNCSAYGCKSRSTKNEVGVTFHRFPKDEPKRSLWIDNMKIKNFTPTKNHRICSKHFENNYFYETTTGKSNLLNQAEPTIFNELPKSVRPKRELRKFQTIPKMAEGQVDEIYEDDDPLVGTDEEEIFEIDVKPDTSASTPSEFRLSTPVLKLSTPSTSNKRGTKRNNTSEVSSIDTAIKKLQKISETKKNSPSHLKTEFDFFCHSLAIQLNNMPLKRALICQSKLQSVMLKERLSQMGDNNSADHEKQHSVSNSPSHSSNSEEEDSTHEEPSHPKT
ncbi:52 kDa repressor of the inhibitor of the protein kinase-like isoform X2 [Diabrotica virgifera virgifera]|uniref:52 kDa repressor of the inhibitor of the protein kinase-like isoform X3 n=1 Tax=Diabrotica virgifera virgifera TaxID=50390 RepID=A0A6P7GWF3_DIAVI|nr:52 kDa repressor of the inhibitor of the protein kinase-like isoform X2 [Diabrotica virgifera virgifera]